MPAVRTTSMVATVACLLSGCVPISAQIATRDVVKVVVANQQSASASILADDGETVTHVNVGEGPHEAAVSPDGRLAVITVYGTQAPGNRLAVLDLTGDSVLRTIDLGVYTRPHGVVFLGDSNTRIAVTSESTGNVVLVDIAAGTIDAVPTNARGSHMVAVDRTGARGWTGNISDNTVSELDLIERRFVRVISVPSRPEGIAMTPDGSEVWVGSNDTGAVTVISTATGEIVQTLTGATFPYRLAASPDGRRMLVVDAMGGRLLIADVGTRAYVGDIGLDSPRGAVVAADNRTAYVTLAEGRVAVVDIIDRVVLRTFPVQSSPDGVGVGIRRGG